MQHFISRAGLESGNTAKKGTVKIMWERMKEKRNQGGFTLIELLIVIIVLAILAAIVVFAVGTTTSNAASASCQSDAKSTETAIEAYHAQMQAWPPADTWTALTKAQTAPQGTSVGPWLRAEPSTARYQINFDAAGDVSADKPAVATYTAADDIDTGTGGITKICDNATS
jgi:general secretion pathway protein G